MCVKQTKFKYKLCVKQTKKSYKFIIQATRKAFLSRLSNTTEGRVVVSIVPALRTSTVKTPLIARTIFRSIFIRGEKQIKFGVKIPTHLALSYSTKYNFASFFQSARYLRRSRLWRRVLHKTNEITLQQQ